MSNSEVRREGSLEAPTRHPIDWQSDQFYDEKDLFEELERVSADKDRFLAAVSHELRTPLTSIRGSLGLLEGEELQD